MIENPPARKTNCKCAGFTKDNGGYLQSHLYLYPFMVLVLLASLSIFAPLSSAAADKTELTKLITETEDPLISVNDLAFLLVTHNFDAVPKNDFVEVRLDKTVYRLVPNGSNPGLANATLES